MELWTTIAVAIASDLFGLVLVYTFLSMALFEQLRSRCGASAGSRG